MLIKLLNIQAVGLWEIIKFVAVKSEEVEDKDLPSYLNWLLHELLSDKAQCWVRLGEDRKIIMLVVTRLVTDKIFDKKSLNIQGIFSFKHVSPEIWQEDFDLLVKFAKQENCDNVTLASKVPRIWEIIAALGCKETYRLFTYDLE